MRLGIVSSAASALAGNGTRRRLPFVFGGFRRPVGERAVNGKHRGCAVNVSPFECSPFARPQAGVGGDDDERAVDASELVGGAVYTGAKRAGVIVRRWPENVRVELAEAGVRRLVETMYGGARERIVLPPAVAEVAFGRRSVTTGGRKRPEQAAERAISRSGSQRAVTRHQTRMADVQRAARH
jgi:hypothetical protein